MKKFLAGIAAAAIITVPMTSFALEAMSKGSLKKATGQAGVSIAVDNVVIAQTLPTITYWDTDGYILGNKIAAESAPAGSSTTENFAVSTGGISIGYTGDGPHKVITLNAITDSAFAGGKYNNDKMNAAFGLGSSTVDVSGSTVVGMTYSGTNVGVMDNALDYVDASGNVRLFSDENNMVTRISPITIDVGTCVSLSKGLSYNKATLAAGGAAMSTTLAPAMTHAVVGVVIGLPTVEIGITENLATKKVIKVKGEIETGSTVKLANQELAETTVHSYDNEIIAIQQEGTKKIAILGGRVEISAH